MKNLSKSALLSLIVIMMASYLWSNLRAPVYTDYFNKEKWISSKNNRNAVFSCTRGKMVNDLLKEYNLLGMSSDNVSNLLGEPDYNEGDYMNIGADEMYVYKLGICEFSDVASGVLVLALKKKKVFRYMTKFD